MTPLLLLESCPVLNRSDNRELYIHLDTMTPLRYRKISTISTKSIIIYNNLQLSTGWRRAASRGPGTGTRPRYPHLAT